MSLGEMWGYEAEAGGGALGVWPRVDMPRGALTKAGKGLHGFILVIVLRSWMSC